MNMFVIDEQSLGSPFTVMYQVITTVAPLLSNAISINSFILERPSASANIRPPTSPPPPDTLHIEKNNGDGGER